MGLQQFDIQQKILWHYDRIYKWINSEIIYPITIEIDPSNTCNESCIWCCWEDHRKDYAVMNWELIEKVIFNLARVGVKGVIWTGGGEPLINSNTVRGIELAKNLGIENGLFTNGILMTPDTIPTIIRCCEWIRVSLGASTPEVFEECHRCDSKYFEQIITNVKEFIRIRRGIRYKQHCSISFGISMMVHPQNFHELYSEAKMAKDLGVDYFQGKPLNQQGTEDATWWNKEVIPLFMRAKQELEDDNFQILTSQYTQDKYGNKGSSFISGITPTLETVEMPRVCHVHNFVTAITANGDVAFCKNLRDNKNSYLGNLKQQTLEEIWYSDRRKNIIEAINTNQCGTFCQNGRLNQILRYIKTPNVLNHPNFL